MSVLILSLSALLPSFADRKVYAHGPGPGSCGNEYEYTLESMTIDNGVHRFDILAEQDNVFLFNANNEDGYDVTFSAHTASQSRDGNTQNGSLWYHHFAFGFGLGVCVYDVGPDQDVTVTIPNIVSSQASSDPNIDEDNISIGPVQWDFNYLDVVVEYHVNYYTKANFPADTGISRVTIVARDTNNTDWNNNQINGLYVNLTHNGQLVDSGFTPVTFTLENNKEYKIGAANYGQYEFYYWQQAWNRGVIMPIKTAETTEALFFANYVTRDEQPTDPSPTTSELTVNTEDRSSGNPINGYWTVLSQGGSTVETGFSPAAFTLDNGENYVVSVADYGQYVFDYWEDTGSTARDRSISISSDAAITAVYRNVNESPTPPDEEEEDGDTTPGGQSAMTVRTIDSGSNSEISGYYTILYDDNGAVLETEFSPATFDVTSEQTYTVEVQDYGSYYFNYWQDNDTDRDRTITATDNEITLTAVYSTSPSAAPPPDDGEEEQPPEQTTDTISVTTVDSSGNQLYGYYTTLSQNGNVIQTAFSPAEFTVNSDQTYQVAVADYGQYVFDHWSDGSFDRFHDAQAGESLTAVYRP